MTHPVAKGFSVIKLVLGIVAVLLVLVLLGWAWAYDLLPWSGIRVNKSDPQWLIKYCKQMVAILPPPPFTYLEKDTAKQMTGPIHTEAVIPEGELKRSETCGIGYSFEERRAYADMGVKYIFDINYRNDFEEAVDEAYTITMLNPTKKTLFGLTIPDKKSAWTNERTLTNQEGGRPHFAYEGLPMIFKRENKKLGLTEYVEAYFGVDYFINLTVVETPK